MSERHDHGPAAPHGPIDAELDVRGIVGFGIGLAILITAVLGAVWLLSAGLKSVAARQDPEPSPLAEANARRPPPEPRLQTAPDDDMRTLRAQEDQILTEYGPADHATGTARIPIDRAIEILVRTGLPEPPQPATTTAPTTPPAHAGAPARAPAAASGRQRKGAAR